MGEERGVGVKGGPGSGHHGHGGRPGKRGGSAPGTGVQSVYTSSTGNQYYHLTTPDAAESIMKEGFRPSASGEIGPGVYLTQNPKLLTDPRFADAVQLDIGIREGISLLEVQDRPNNILSVLNSLYGHDRATEIYHDTPVDQMFDGGQVRWEWLHGLVKNAGFGGIVLTGHASDKNVVVFDPDDVEVRGIGEKGGPGSGHYGHSGRPGRRGGSLPGTSSSPDPAANIVWSLCHGMEVDDMERAVEAYRGIPEEHFEGLRGITDDAEPIATDDENYFIAMYPSIGEAPGYRTIFALGYYDNTDDVIHVHEKYWETMTPVHELGHHFRDTFFHKIDAQALTSSLRAFRNPTWHGKLESVGLRPRSVKNADELFADMYAVWARGTDSQYYRLNQFTRGIGLNLDAILGSRPEGGEGTKSADTAVRQFNPRTDEGKQLYEIQSVEMDDAVFFVPVEVDVGFEKAAQTPWYYVVEVMEDTKGGPGSGHHGHSGRPGHRGGSVPGNSLSFPKGDPRNNPAFRAWFGDSKMVDKDGKPLILYHGTADEEFTSFDPSRAGEMKYSDWGRGIYFTPSRWIADAYREDAVKKVDSEAQRLYRAMEDKAREFGTTSMEAGLTLGRDSDEYKQIKAMEREWFARLHEIEEGGGGRVIATYLKVENPMYHMGAYGADSFLASIARGKGHDGIVITREDGSIDEVVVFSPRQIKGVDNVGTFDPQSPDFTKALHSVGDAISHVTDTVSLAAESFRTDSISTLEEAGSILADRMASVTGWIRSVAVPVLEGRKGGKGSGHRGHQGRPGHRGGSLPGKRSASGTMTDSLSRRIAVQDAIGYAPSESTVTRARQKTAEMIEELSKESGLGTPDEVEQEIRERLEGLEGDDLAVRRSLNGALGVLEDGRFKTQFETGTSGGAYAPELRTEAEKEGLGVPADIDVTKRPVYGYLDNPDNATTMYGPVQFIMRPEVKRRTTVVIGDSLERFADGDVVGALADQLAESPECWDGGGFSGNLFSILKYGTPWRFIEAQIHGGVSINDVAKMRVTVYNKDDLDTSTYDWLFQMAEERGIEVELDMEGAR